MTDIVATDVGHAPSFRSPPGRGRLAAAAAGGVTHAALAALDGTPTVLLLAGATVTVAGAWRWLLAGLRHDLAAVLGVLWLAVAATTATGGPVSAAPAAAGAAALSAACRSPW